MMIQTLVKKISAILAVVGVLSVSALVLTPAPANALGDAAKSSACSSIGGCTNGEAKINKTVSFVIKTFTVVVGIIAVIMIIIGGFKYITSGGDSSKVTSAKNTIIYALIGLVIVALAQVIVRFVLNKV